MTIKKLFFSSLFAGVVGFVGVTPAHAATVALYHMSDPAVMTDSSGNGNDGVTTAITSIVGTSGNGYGFDGTSSNVDVPDSASLNPGTKTITITVHVKTSVAPNMTVGDYDVIRKGLSGAPGGEYKMEMDPISNFTQAQALCLFKDTSGVVGQIQAGPNLVTNTWHTVICKKTATQVTLTVDGTSFNKTVSLGSISNTKDLRVGEKQSTGGDFYNGDMDEVSIATQ